MRVREMKMISSPLSLLCFVYLVCSCVALTTRAPKEAVFFEVNNLEFGHNDVASWFKFEDENRQLIEYHGMQPVKGMFSDSDYKTSTFSKHVSPGHWATMTIVSSDQVSITLHKDGKIATVSPGDEFESLRKTNMNLRRLSTSSHVLTYSQSHFQADAHCHAIKLPGKGESKTKSEPSKNRDLQDRADRWGDCYPGQDSTRYLDIGIVVDLGWFQDYNSDETRAMKAIEVVIANTNLVYYYQFNILIRAQQVVMITSASGASNIDDMMNQGPTCPLDIEDALDAMSEFSEARTEKVVVSLLPTTNRADTNLAQLAHWHLLTTCYSSGTVGIAYLQTICDFNLYTVDNVAISPTRANVGVSSRVFDGVTWLTFAHELGHGFGADHSFEEGEGTTGGIMDYGDGLYEGVYQFNFEYRFDDFCDAITDFLSCTDFFSLVPGAESCSGLETDCADGAGKCFAGQCQLGQMLLAVNLSTEVLAIPYVESLFAVSTLVTLDSVETKEVVMASPLDGCDPLVGTYTDKIVVIRRGDCSFEVKSTNADNAGAAAVVIWNTVETSLAMTALGYSGPIPCVLITNSAGLELQTKLNADGGSAPGKLGPLLLPEQAVIQTSNPASSPVGSPTPFTLPPTIDPSSVLTGFTDVLLQYIVPIGIGAGVLILAVAVICIQRSRARQIRQPVSHYQYK